MTRIGLSTKTPTTQANKARHNRLESPQFATHQQKGNEHGRPRAKDPTGAHQQRRSWATGRIPSGVLTLGSPRHMGVATAGKRANGSGPQRPSRSAPLPQRDLVFHWAEPPRPLATVVWTIAVPGRCRGRPGRSADPLKDQRNPDAFGRRGPWTAQQRP